MATSSDHSTRRWVATLIVLLLAAQAVGWLWRTYQRAQKRPPQQATETTLQRKIAASQAYDDALLEVDSLLTQHAVAAASRQLDSLRQLPTDNLFRVEQQKLRATLQRLDSVKGLPTVRRP